MMKKMLTRAICMALALCLLLGGAQAAAGSIMPQRAPDDAYLRVDSAAVLGESVWFLAFRSGNMVLWRWQEGDEEAVMVGQPLMRADNLRQGQELPEDDLRVKYAVSVLLSDGERLLSVNTATGLVFAIDPTGEEIAFSDVTTLADTDVFYRRSRSGSWYAGPSGTAVCGGYLYWLGDGWDEAAQNNRRRLIRFSLTDGSAQEVTAENVTTICAGPDGKLCILSRPEGRTEDDRMLPYVISLYDPADGSIVACGQIDTSRAVGSIAYAPSLEVVIWQEGTNVMGTKLPGEEQLCAYVPTSANGKLAVLGETVILTQGAQTFVRPLVPGLQAPESLQVLHGSYDEGARAFAEICPDVPLEMINEPLDEAGYMPWLQPADGIGRVDVIRLYTTDGDDIHFTTLRDQGMLLDLSCDPAIVAYVDTLYPPFRDLVTGENGEIWAVPTETVSYTGFFVNRRAMQDMGISPEELPTNMVELCAFVTRWDAEYADRFPNYCCFEGTEDTKRFLTDMAIDMWIGHCQATGREIRFDDPEFRCVLEAINGISTVRTDVGMQVTNPEISDYKSGLFWVDCQLVGNWASYMEDYSDRIFIPMTLTENTPYHAGVQGVELWVVSSASECPEYAVKYVSGLPALINDKYAHVLQTTRTEPVESPYYAESLATSNRELGEWQMELLQNPTPEREKELQQLIADRERYNATELRRQMYTITPSAVENYVTVIAPAMYIQRWNVLQHTSEGVNGREHIRDRWLNGTITTDQFVHEMDARMLMLEMAQD